MKSISYIDRFDESYRNSFSFSHRIKIRFSETDMFGHMNNTAPFTYFEDGRIEFFKKIGIMQAWMSSNGEKIPVVADIQCDFIQQGFFDEEITLCVKINRIGTSSVDLHYLGINQNRESLFVGRGTVVQISKHSGKSVPWSEEEKKRMLQLEEPENL
ncbi:acyl-CoA thioesterase [Metabacillus bambusae]|uniref:Acyl-CoA thioesterase n=1 Tax=Metabacillus bambusae TaxID=2795218 RepID=A0ABS3N814_9BACI|nr:thioesterase family protein [Metabacillus bambusae]MBO1514295.1 acyl-CoA thioesterase [Metabacillus bambusae]